MIIVNILGLRKLEGKVVNLRVFFCLVLGMFVLRDDVEVYGFLYLLVLYLREVVEKFFVKYFK